MQSWLTKFIQISIFGIIATPFILTSLENINEYLKISTAITLALAIAGSLLTAIRFFSSNNLKKTLSNNIEIARTEFREIAFPEFKMMGWKLPKIEATSWEQCENKNIAGAICLAKINMPSLLLFIAACIFIILEIGFYQWSGEKTRLIIAFPILKLPIMRAIEVSFFCLIQFITVTLLVCRIYSKIIQGK